MSLSNIFKKFIVVQVILPGLATVSSAQSLAINTDGTTSHASALLDVKSTTKGLLIPRMTTAQRQAIASPATGLMVFDINSNGFWFYNGSSWTNINAGPGTGWELTGNSGINPATHFLGTIDNVPLNVRVNNLRSGLIDQLSGNTGWGYKTLLNTSGILSSNSNSVRNTAFGTEALSSLDFGQDNSAFGYNALKQNVGGNNLGQPFGWRNTAVGSSALFSNTGGMFNTATGYYSLRQNINGDENSAFGSNALENNQGNQNNAFGSFALWANQTGSSNSAFGYAALQLNETGFENTAVGYQSLHFNNGYNNTGLGVATLLSNTLGYENTAVGAYALNANKVAPFNTSVGAFSLFRNEMGQNNTAVGYKALEKNVLGNFNTSVGLLALQENKGSNHTAIGVAALYSNINGFGNTAIGAGADVTQPNLQNASAIGAYAKVGASNSLVLGGTGGDAVNVGIGVTVPISTLHVRGSAKFFAFGETHTGNFWNGTSNMSGVEITSTGNDAYIGIQRASGAALHISKPFGSTGDMVAFFNSSVLVGRITSDGVSTSYITTSDFRLKENRKPTQYSLQTLMQIKAEDYNYISDNNKNTHTGFIAQDLFKIYPPAVVPGGDDPKTNPWMIDYSRLTPLLVKAVQEQQQIIDKQQKQIDDLLLRIESVEKKK